MKNLLILFIIALLFGCENPAIIKMNQITKSRDSLQLLLDAQRKTKTYYETGWTLVKINGSLDAEGKDSVEMYGVFGLYRMFDEGTPGLTYKIQDIELNGACTSFEPGHKLYIISKTPF